MGGFRKGDVSISIGGKAYVLRLTLGALAEIDQRLAVRGPVELAEKLKNLSANDESAETAFTLLECLLRPAISPPCGLGVADIPSLVRQANPQEFMPIISALFEKNFGGKTNG